MRRFSDSHNRMAALMPPASVLASGAIGSTAMVTSGQKKGAAQNRLISEGSPQEITVSNRMPENPQGSAMSFSAKNETMATAIHDLDNRFISPLSCQTFDDRPREDQPRHRRHKR